jgi:hypothetical protein
MCAARIFTPYAGACASDDPFGLCVQGNTDGVIEGRRYDVRGCFRAPEPLGPRAPENLDFQVCEPFPTRARGPEGECWLFANSCLPDGFDAIGLFDLQDCLTVTDSCADSLQCAEQQVATIVGCLTCDEAQRALAERMAETLSRYGACNSDADCIVEGGPSCAGQCPGAINRNFTTPFTRDASRLERGFCTLSGWAEKCGVAVATPACDMAPVCRDNLCTVGADMGSP